MLVAGLVGWIIPVFNLGSRQQIGRWLQHFGWEPTALTDAGIKRLELIEENQKARDVELAAFELDKKLGKYIKVDETILAGVDIPQAQLISEYLDCTEENSVGQ
jgi:hypothetical protein